MEESRTHYLYQKFNDRTATNAEVQEFYEALSDPAVEKAIKSPIESTWNTMKSSSINEVREQRAIDIYNQIISTELPVIENNNTASRSKISRIINKTKVVRLLNYQMVAACIAVVMCGYAAWYFSNRDKLKPLSQTELATIVPKTDKATITLSTGEVVNLEQLQPNKSVAVGNTVISKDEKGELTYRPGKNDASEHLISTLQTSRSTQYVIVLSDGTKVYLNATSSLSYPEKFGEGDRVAELHGEAYFEVQKTSQHSKFIVKTDRQLVQVLGTKFNINAYSDLPVVKTTLAEGSVRMTPINKSLQPVILKPDQQTILNSSSVVVAKVDAQLTIAWKDGFFVFEGNNREEVIREIARWYNIDIEYKPAKKRGQFIGKLPKNMSLLRLMKLLNFSGIKVEAYKTKDNQRKLIIN